MPDHLARARTRIAGLGLTPSARAESCPGCGASVPGVPGGPVHRSLGASPGCWALYTALLATEFTAFDARTHQLSVDTYAAQHVGETSPAAIQSACAHLVALCLSLEHGLGVEDLRPLTGDLVTGRWFEPRPLEPPAVPWPMTLIDLLDADSPEGYGERVRAWAASTWGAWSARHGTVRRWAAAVRA